jgi:hypothetical protein
MRRLASVAVATAILCSTTAVQAQPAGATPSADRKDERLSRLAREAERLSVRVMRQLGRARVRGDAGRARCLDRVLTQTHSLVRQIRRRAARVERAPTASKKRDARHARQVREVLSRRRAALSDAVLRCTGGNPSSPQGTTRVEVVIDPDVPRQDPTRLRGDRWPDRRWSR